MVNCPFCGTEMELQSGDFSPVWYGCPKCRAREYCGGWISPDTIQSIECHPTDPDHIRVYTDGQSMDYIELDVSKAKELASILMRWAILHDKPKEGLTLFERVRLLALKQFYEEMLEKLREDD